MTEILGKLFILALGVSFIWAAVDYYRKRAKMTPQQRAEFDEEIRDDLRVW